MIIKKFIGKNEEEAIAAAKAELGTGIVIMNVRSVKASGFLSFLKPQKTEVTVALENEREQPRQGGFPQAAPRSSFSVVTPDDDAAMTSDAKAGQQLIRAAQQGLIPPLKVNAEAGKPATESVNHGRDAISALAAEMQSKEKTKDTAQEERFTSAKAVERSLEALRDADSSALKAGSKEAVATPARSSSGAEQSRKPAEIEEEQDDQMLSFLKVLYNTLLENEVDERYANELTDEVAKIKKRDVPIDIVLASVYQKMILKCGKAQEIEEASGDGVRAEIFVGPTGVGKTTTIAKLASKLHLQKKKVALITVDTYRIAAAEQLHTYASIMGIPFRVVYSIEEMRQVMEDFKDYDYLMVDTAGHSPHNDEQKKVISEFVDVLIEDLDHDVFLVLSATTKYRDLVEITDSYSDIDDYKLIFTKIDETGASGNIYNIRMHTGAPISYITNGQNVPDDIAVFDAQKVVKELLGGKRELVGQQD